MFSQTELISIMPRLHPAHAARIIGYLKSAMNEFEINTPKRIAAFLAQLAHESIELRFMEEMTSGSAYEGRKDLGNTKPGDGPRYKGRGPIQLTGRANYRAAGASLGLDLEAYPEWAARPNVGFRVAAWFWKSHGLNELADSDQFDAITRRINGGLNGKESRDRYYKKACEVLMVKHA